MLRMAAYFVSTLTFAAALSLGIMHVQVSQAAAHESLEDDDYAAGDPGDPSKPFRVVKVSMNEGDGAMSYAPAEIDVKKGEQIEFIIENDGSLKHEFRLDSVAHNASHRIEMQKNPEMEHDDPNAQTIQPGNQAEILWEFSKPGVFEFACLIPGHYEAGMHGKIVVK